MANYIDKLRDKLNNYIFPITLTKAVYKENTSTTLDDLLIDKLDTSTYTASDVLAKLKTVDGAGSGIDADTVDGKHYSDIVNYMDSGIDNVEVGGRNYFSNSDFREGMNVYWQLLNSSPSSNFEISGGELKVTFNAGTKSDFGTMNFLSQNNLEGQDYITVSSLIRGNGTLRIRFGASTMPMQTINNEQFKRVIFTIPRSNFGNGNLIIEVASGTLYFYKIKAETGNKATDWAPSPEEVEGLIDSKVDKSQVLTNVPSGAKFSDTIYTHPSTHPSSMITQDATHRFTTDVEKTTWNAKETPSGAQLKANIAEENAKTYTDETIPTKVSQLTNDSNYITQSELGSVGYGDMAKGVYDINNNGVVDNAEKVNGHTVLSNVPADAVFTDTTYVDATTSVHGLMSSSDKTKLDGIAFGANNYSLPVATSSILGGVKSGTDITVDSSGNVSVADNSHNHTVSNITGLQTALDAKIATSLLGTNNGVAQLGSDGKVPSSQLPSYVDDVLEYSGYANFPPTGETGKIYVDTTTNLTYRWSGSIYTEITPSLALGETSSTAYAGDKGKAVTDALASHKNSTSNPHSVTASQVGLGAFETTATNIKMNGTHGVGVLSTVARADHIHPVDTSRAPASHTHTASSITDLTATAAELNVLDGITASTTEINYLDGVTSNVQTQLNSKASISSPALTGTPTAPTAAVGTNTAQLATTAFVQNATSSSSGGTTIVTSSSQPSSQAVNDLWFAVV